MNELRAAATAAKDRAYAPYSDFRVGAALETEEGIIFSGCNIENASYGLTICAERSAVAAAVSGGHRSIVRMLIVTDSNHPVAPCGACRQVLAEFNPALAIESWSVTGASRSWSLTELLPDGFGREDLH